MQDTTITERDQRVIQHLQDSWKSLKEISPEALGDVSQFVAGLPNPYREAALNTIAQHVVSVMSLHMLSLMTTFQNTAEQDEISPEDCEEIFEQVLPDTFRILNKLNKHISVESFEDLVALSHITGSLQTLSKATSAEVAEGWMYELPSMYYRQVKREHLVAKDFVVWTRSEEEIPSSQSITIQGSLSPSETVPIPPVNVENIHVFKSIA